MLSTQAFGARDFLTLSTPLVTMTKDLFSPSQPAVTILDLGHIDRISAANTANWLNPQERTQLAVFKYKKRNREWLGGRICAKQCLKLFSRLQGNENRLSPPKDYGVVADESGKPFFSNLKDCQTFLFPHLSISHSKTLATALCATNRCGIDIQYRSHSLIKVREKFLNSTEELLLQKKLPNLSNTAQLSLIWAGKEALKKMLSSTGMPGFHDLRLERARCCDSNSALLYFSETRCYNTLFPVVAGMQSDEYGIALCCEQR